MRKSKLLILCILSVSIFLMAAVSVAQDLQDLFIIIKEEPMTVTGILGYASARYWIDLPKGKYIYLCPEQSFELDSQLRHLIGTKVTLKGKKITYKDGAQFFCISNSNLGATNQKKEGGKFTEAKNKKAILYDGKIVYEDKQDIYFSINLKKVFSIGSDKVALVELSYGGVMCPASYIFLTAKPNGDVLISEQFGNCSDLPKITKKGNDIVVRFPGNPPETWVYQNGRVRHVR